MTVIRDLTMTRGDRRTFRLIEDANGVQIPVRAANGDIADLTGLGIRFTAKRRFRDADEDAVISKEGTITDAAGGLFDVRLQAADTDALDAPLTLHYDIQVTEGIEPETLQKGKLHILPDVTRSP